MLNKILLTIFLSFFLITGYVNAGLLNVGEGGTSLIQQTVHMKDSAGYASAPTLGSLAKTIIQTFLGLLGIVFVGLIIYAGYNWMTAQGEEEKVRKAQQTIQRAVIGLIIIVSAYAITYFVFLELDKTQSLTLL